MSLIPKERIRSLAPRARFQIPIEMLGHFFRYNGIQKLSGKPGLPRAMAIYVTYRCNMRCRICGIWKQNPRRNAEEMSLEEFRSVFSDPLFSRLALVNINGGEPNLRDDLVDIVASIVEKFTHLKMITLNSNGLPPGKTVAHAEEISRLCLKNRIRFSVSISLHKPGPGYDDIAGVKNSYARVKEALDGLREINRRVHGFYLSVNCVISSLNLEDLEDMVSWGRREHIPVNFTLGEVRERFHNLDMAGEVFVPEGSRDALVKFLRRLGKSRRTYLQHALRYSRLADMLDSGRKRSQACHYALGGFILGSDGLVYYCKNCRAIGNSRERSPLAIYFDRDNLQFRENELFKNACPRCPSNTYNHMEMAKDILPVIRFLVTGR